ncbi:serine--tRNA ligase [bacterium]|jgi:seryl-tRNA synthetase|nr:serine--tRNA ligase [bacterium]MBT3795550.1 serine--tRNA ligase [bacterium]MBT4634520.1 serine--tRNA ligase [bacterium]
MIDPNFIFNNKELVLKKLSNKKYKLDYNKFYDLYVLRKKSIQNLEELKAKLNEFNKKITQEKRKPSEDELKEIKEFSGQSKDAEKVKKEVEQKLTELLLEIPNLHDDSVPIGDDELSNKEIRKKGTIKKQDFKILNHIELGKNLKLFDLEAAAKITGARFNLYKGLGAKLERALINFMLDEHSKKNYTEIFPPFICNKESFIGTGNLPKFEEELFKIEGTNNYLIPTAEVPLTNMHSNEILDSSELPIKYVAYSACFRSEAGSYGKDVKGLIRQHQFNKIELVKITDEFSSYEELETLTEDACSILDKLELPYRVVTLSSGDTSFSSSKTYDIEVWIPSENKYREISSCSNFLSFQSRRANIKYKIENKSNFVHTLNGSGLAVGRTFVAILENFQNSDGTVTIPKILRPYLNNLDIIS